MILQQNVFIPFVPDIFLARSLQVLSKPWGWWGLLARYGLFDSACQLSQFCVSRLRCMSAVWLKYVANWNMKHSFRPVWWCFVISMTQANFLELVKSGLWFSRSYSGRIPCGFNRPVTTFTFKNADFHNGILTYHKSCFKSCILEAVKSVFYTSKVFWICDLLI
jgi:hypothetical protein